MPKKNKNNIPPMDEDSVRSIEDIESILQKEKSIGEEFAGVPSSNIKKSNKDIKQHKADKEVFKSVLGDIYAGGAFTIAGDSNDKDNVEQQNVVAVDRSNDVLAIEIVEIMDSLGLSEDETNIVRNYFKKVTVDPYILHIIPKCDTEKCMFNGLNCPFIKLKKIPIGKPCPIAMGLAISLRDQWMQAISSRLQPQTSNNKDEYNSIEYDIVIYRLIVSLVEVDLRDIILDNEISRNGLIEEHSSCQISKTGEVYWMPGESVASIVHEKIQTRRDTILKQLLLTPEISAKYKLLKDENEEKKNDIDELKDRVNKRNKELLLENEKLSNVSPEYGTRNEYKTIYDIVGVDKKSESTEES